MSLDPGAMATLDVERPVAGGWMLARLLGQVVFVAGAIPGERVVARVDRVARGTVYAEVVEVVDPSPDRRPGVEGRCGGTLYGHIAYPRQVQLKAAVIEDAWRRLARQALPSPLSVVPSPERGYRTRARLHAEGHRLGFYREGSHTLCDAASTGQLSDQAVDWLGQVQQAMARLDHPGLHAVELAENLSGTARVCHLELTPDGQPVAWPDLLHGASGASVASTNSPTRSAPLFGEAAIIDEIPVTGGDGLPGGTVRLRHDVRAFFQGNRFLLGPLVEMVLTAVAEGPVLDLYAGTGLFGLSVAVARPVPVTLVEGDQWSGRDLELNARPFGPRATVARSSVEAYVARPRDGHRTWIVDPPRQGLAPGVRAAILRDRPSRLVYVSCDVATLARDVAALTGGGYEVRSVVGLDMFPSTAHVEALCVLDAPRRPG